MKFSCRHYQLSLLLLLTSLLASCASSLDPADERGAHAENLTRQIMALSPTIQWREAHDFATTAVEVSAGLGKKYDVALSPWLHNASIMVGLKERGYCYQYAEDLYDSLKDINNEHLQMHWIASNRGHMNEHHALTVIAKGAPWNSGIIIDGWRHNGNLYFAPLKTDDYPWIDDGIAHFEPQAAAQAAQ